MADSFVSNKLQNWGLSQYIEKFEEQCITEESFLLLSMSDVKELIPKVGHRVIFLKEMAAIKEVSIENDLAYDVSSNSSMTDSTAGQSSEAATPPRKKFLASVNYDIEEILLKNPYGIGIIKEYEMQPFLSTTSRCQLVQVLVNSLMEKCGTHPSSHQKETLAKEIVMQLPKMHCGSPPGYQHLFQPACDGLPASGFLQERILNVQRHISKQKKKLKDVPTFSEAKIENNEVVEGMIKWVKANDTPFSKVQEYMQKTFDARRQWIIGVGGPMIVELLSRFPRFNDQCGYTWVNQDFSRIFKTVDIDFEEKIFNVAAKILKVIKLQSRDKLAIQLIKEVENKNLFENEQSNKDALINAALYLLPNILPTHTSKQLSNGTVWKPTLSECRSDFIDLQPIGTPIEEYKKKKEASVSNVMLTWQPQVLVLGDSILNPHQTIPKPENSGPTVVGIGMTLQQIINVDAKSEQLTTSLYMTYTWHDDRLTWTPEQFDGIKLTRIAVDRIWNPNVILENSLTHEMSESLRVNALVKFNGDVEWLPPAIYRSSCAIDISLFPFDWQNCSMVFRSASYDQSQFIFNFSYGNEVYVDENVFVPNGEWDLLQKPITLSAHDDGKFQRARFSFVIKRRPQFYVLNLILPCVMLSILSCFVFYMPLVAGEKIGLAISLLLGYTVFVFLIAQVMPSTSLRIPILSTFLIFNILTLFASMFGGTLVYNFHFRSMRTHKMPKQLKRFVFEVIGPCVGLRKPDIKWAATSARNRTDVGNGKSKLLENAKNLHRDISASPSNTIFHSQATRYGFGSRRFSAKPADTYPVLVKNAPVELRPTFNFFNFITGRIRIQRHSEIITDDWIFFALILDRICFWIYLVTMIIGLLGFYVTILIIEYPKLL